jgi:hypothetical protein
MGDDLRATHDAIESRFGNADAGARDIGLDARTSKGESVPDYSKVLIVREHGEMGPLLTVKGQKFTGEKAIPKQKFGFLNLTREQVEHQLTVLRDLPDSEYKRGVVAKYEARLAELN